MSLVNFKINLYLEFLIFVKKQINRPSTLSVHKNITTQPDEVLHIISADDVLIA